MGRMGKEISYDTHKSRNEALKRFKHEHIVGYIDSFNEGTTMTVIQELCEYVDLGTLIKIQREK